MRKFQDMLPRSAIISYQNFLINLSEETKEGQKVFTQIASKYLLNYIDNVAFWTYSNKYPKCNLCDLLAQIPKHIWLSIIWWSL